MLDELDGTQAGKGESGCLPKMETSVRVKKAERRPMYDSMDSAAHDRARDWMPGAMLLENLPCECANEARVSIQPCRRRRSTASSPRSGSCIRARSWAASEAGSRRQRGQGDEWRATMVHRSCGRSWDLLAQSDEDKTECPSLDPCLCGARGRSWCELFRPWSQPTGTRIA